MYTLKKISVQSESHGGKGLIVLTFLGQVPLLQAGAATLSSARCHPCNCDCE